MKKSLLGLLLCIGAFSGTQGMHMAQEVSVQGSDVSYDKFNDYEKELVDLRSGKKPIDRAAIKLPAELEAHHSLADYDNATVRNIGIALKLQELAKMRQDVHPNVFRWFLPGFFGEIWNSEQRDFTRVIKGWLLANKRKNGVQDLGGSQVISTTEEAQKSSYKFVDLNQETIDLIVGEKPIDLATIKLPQELEQSGFKFVLASLSEECKRDIGFLSNLVFMIKNEIPICSTILNALPGDIKGFVLDRSIRNLVDMIERVADINQRGKGLIITPEVQAKVIAQLSAPKSKQQYLNFKNGMIGMAFVGVGIALWKLVNYLYTSDFEKKQNEQALEQLAKECEEETTSSAHTLSAKVSKLTLFTEEEKVKLREQLDQEPTKAFTTIANYINILDSRAQAKHAQQGMWQRVRDKISYDWCTLKNWFFGFFTKTAKN